VRAESKRAKAEAIAMAEAKTFGYARVSTDEQNLGIQVEALLAAGIAREDIYEEKVSTRQQKRRKLEYIIENLLREDDTLAVWKIDRLARSIRDLHRLLDRITEKGAFFRSLTQSFDTTTAIGRMMVNQLAVFVEFDRDLTQERTIAGVARARAAGKQIGNKPKLTKVQGREIKAARRLPEDQRPTYRVLAKQYGVTASTIRNYAVGRKPPRKS